MQPLGPASGWSRGALLVFSCADEWGRPVRQPTHINLPGPRSLVGRRWCRAETVGGGPMGLIGDLFRIHPAPGSGWVALRASATVLTMQSILLALDRLDLAVYVAFGAFASAYGGPGRSATRWRIQLALGALLTFAVITGALAATTSHRPWLVLAVASGWAAVASVLSQRYRWRPPGPLFLVFAAATAAAMPASAADVLHTGATTAMASVFAVALGLVEVRLLGAAEPLASAFREVSAVGWALATGCGVAVLTAGVIATMVGLMYPSWAMVAAVAPLAVAPLVHQLVRGVHRITGTAAGLALAGVLLSLGPFPAVLLLLIVASLHAATDLLVTRHYGLALVFITPLALLLTQLSDPRPDMDLLLSRIVETVVGVGVGLVVAGIIQFHTRAGSSNARRFGQRDASRSRISTQESS